MDDPKFVKMVNQLEQFMQQQSSHEIVKSGDHINLRYVNIGCNLQLFQMNSQKESLERSSF